MARYGELAVGDVWTTRRRGDVEVTFRLGGDRVEVRAVGGGPPWTLHASALLERVAAAPVRLAPDAEGEAYPPPVPTPDWGSLLDRAGEPVPVAEVWE